MSGHILIVVFLGLFGTLRSNAAVARLLQLGLVLNSHLRVVVGDGLITAPLRGEYELSIGRRFQV